MRGVSADHLLVRFAGTASAVETAFRTDIVRLRLADGSIASEATAAPSVPRPLAGDVTAVVGLDNALRLHSMLERPTRAGLVARARSDPGRAAREPAALARLPHAKGGPHACASAETLAVQSSGITDDQVAASYGVNGLYEQGDLGAGQTVAIYELEPFAMSDVAKFDKCYFGASHTSQVSVVDGGRRPARPAPARARPPSTSRTSRRSRRRRTSTSTRPRTPSSAPSTSTTGSSPTTRLIR